MNETIHLIENRKSIRAYDKKPLTSEHIDLIINGAMRAPTAGNMMHYSIIEITDQDKKEQLVKTCDNQPFIAKAPLVLLFLADMQRWYDFFEYSLVPDFCHDNNLEFRPPQESDLLLACCDALVAAQNAVITAESLGIGSCYIGDIMENIEIHRQMFNLPYWVFPIILICFGFPTASQKKRKMTPRFPKKFVHFKDTYSKIDGKDFEEMLTVHFGGETKKVTFHKNARNIGQHVYLRKTGSDFAAEMSRSVKVALTDWIKKT
ncbi:MAG: nitroreductase family protein [Candidatus Heimdallarchaeota archaeon]|nr:MAG: nitroreductase family protein [Candidatus Heimdallarchaeota archaeon]